MTPYELMLSESQERMVVIVEKGKEDIAYKIFEKWGLHAVDIGEVTDGQMLRCYFKGEVVAEVPARSLADDAPIYEVSEGKPYYLDEVQKVKIETIPDLQKEQIQAVFLKLLGEPNIASKKYVFEQYDHMVQTNTTVVPGIADAAVLRIKGTDKKIATTTDCNSRYCYLDPYNGGAIAIAEAARNLACVGARPVGTTDCLNFANPEKPENFWVMRKVCEGLSEACRQFESPIISGNVSMYNESDEGAIYPTPVIGMVGLIEPETPRVTMEFKTAGEVIVLLGKTRNALGGTEFLKSYHDMEAGLPPQLNFTMEKNLHETLISLVKSGLVSSTHDLAEGGLVVALAESAVTGNKGVEIDLAAGSLRKDALLFAETQSRAIVSLDNAKLDELKKVAAKHNIAYAVIGKVAANDKFKVSIDGELIINVELTDLQDIYHHSIEKYLKA
jgi:phosphoribosylformylglycinamidine synthase